MDKAITCTYKYWGCCLARGLLSCNSHELPWLSPACQNLSSREMASVLELERWDHSWTSWREYFLSSSFSLVYRHLLLHPHRLEAEGRRQAPVADRNKPVGNIYPVELTQSYRDFTLDLFACLFASPVTAPAVESI